jgi:hypothetical protein
VRRNGSLSLLMLIGLCGAPAHAGCLPPQLGAALHETYPDMKIVELQDLLADDKQIMKDAHLAECPGVAHGNFDGRGLSYAVTLFSKSPELRQMLVLVGSENSNKAPQLRVLDDPVPVARLAIIRRVPPGTLESVEGKKVVAKYDAVAYETLEAGVAVFYLSDDKFLDVITSE